MGRPTDVLTAPVLRDVYGVELCIMDGPDGHPVVLPLRGAKVA